MIIGYGVIWWRIWIRIETLQGRDLIPLKTRWVWLTKLCHRVSDVLKLPYGGLESSDLTRNLNMYIQSSNSKYRKGGHLGGHFPREDRIYKRRTVLPKEGRLATF
ncbi:hypothetical protein AVEN_61022-1 [Araneus ventricosus]|uniref:Uncharacterized protein n=1 Tax=Araneus ventricosus TaxID=182803 RepID=A0A4Y2WM60_ARAVE|nr:hypothetical protein AVEN_61022-1 [Araneus ventricosus]